jgi:hypothetical protein
MSATESQRIIEREQKGYLRLHATGLQDSNAGFRMSVLQVLVEIWAGT